MGKKAIILGVALGGLLGMVVIFVFLSQLGPKGAGILIESTPASDVYIGGERVGRTPYETTINSGEIVLKLVPDSSSGLPVSPYETKLILSGGVKTVVRRVFGGSEDTSSGEIISFEKSGDGAASISVISNPDSVQVTLDGRPQNFTPLKISSIAPGEHQLYLKTRGYADRVFSVQALEGYKLTVIAKLALKLPSKAEKQVLSAVNAQEEEKKMVEISTTPTGYLRVREAPSISSKEVAQVKPGEKFTLVEKDAVTGWLKIEVKKGLFGWISGIYATVIETPP